VCGFIFSEREYRKNLVDVKKGRRVRKYESVVPTGRDESERLLEGLEI
jgi:hypothetical protein